MLVNPVKDLLDAFVIALLIVSLQSLQWKISILNHGGAVTGEGTGLRGGGERVINAKCLSFFGAAVAVLLLPSA